MPTQVIYPSTSDTYDSNEIEVINGVSASLKKQALFNKMIGIWRYDSSVTQDDSDYLRSMTVMAGTPVITTDATEDNVMECLDTEYLSIPVLFSSAPTDYTFSVKFKGANSTHTEFLFEYDNNSINVKAFYIQSLSSIYFQVRKGTSGYYQYIKSSWSTTDWESWHTYAITVAEDVSSNVTVKIYIDGSLQTTIADTSGAGQTDAGNPSNLGASYAGLTNGDSSHGYFKHFVIANSVLDATELTALHNNELVKYVTEAQIVLSDEISDSGLIKGTSFACSCTGSDGFTLSDDSGTNFKAWNGSSWGTTTTTYNTEATVNTYIASLPLPNQTLMVKVHLLSDGWTDATVGALTIGTELNEAPDIDAGRDKIGQKDSIGYHLSDAVVSDSNDNLSTMEWQLNNGGWNTINKGSYATWQEAVRATPIDLVGLNHNTEYLLELKGTDALSAVTLSSKSILVQADIYSMLVGIETNLEALSTIRSRVINIDTKRRR